MKPITIANRYQYTPTDPIYQSKFTQIFRTYDKVTKRQLYIQFLSQENQLMDALREFKHPFIHYIYDKVIVNQTKQNPVQKIAYILQPGLQANLQYSMKKIKHFSQQDALVMFKYVLLIVKQLHGKNLISTAKLCLQNILICNYGLVKLGYNIINDEDYPAEYSSPEKLNNKQLTVKSDVYSLGVILYKMLYGEYPFVLEKGEGQKQFVKKIKTKKFNNENNVNNKVKSPLEIVISREVHFLVMSMLDFHPENRPDLQAIFNSQMFIQIQIQTDLQKYLKPKGSIVPQSFHKKYLIYRPSKFITKNQPYTSQVSYLVFNTLQKTFMTMYVPQIRMFQTQPRKVQSYYEKLKAIIKNFKLPGCQHLVKIDDVQRFRQEAILVENYCNQGNLYEYLEKRKVSAMGWLSEAQTNVIMYLVAIGLRQIRNIGIGSMHTISHKRIMIHNTNVKIREPGLLTPIVEKKLQANSNVIDFFAPELKEKMDFVQLDKSDMWSYGVLYIYLLSGQMPKLDKDEQYQNNIDLTQLKTQKKNINLIGKCIDFNVKKRLQLQSIKIQNVDQRILSYMLQQNQDKGYAEQIVNNNNNRLDMDVNFDDNNYGNLQKHIQNGKQYDINNSQLSSNAQELKQNKNVMFKHRKKRLFKHYNRIISQSTTSSCRLFIKSLAGLLILWIVFFGIFFINGGIGLLRTNFYRKITLQVPYNYGTSLYNMTILSTNGGVIAEEYKNFSYQQFMKDLRCLENIYSKNGKDQVWNFVNSEQTLYCLFGFIWAIALSVLYVVQVYKLDLPTLLLKRKEKERQMNSGVVHESSKTLNKQLYHLAITNLLVIPSLMFTFFYTFAFQYVIQTTPCLGLQSLAYPKFTSIETILNGDILTFFLNVFLTIILWGILLLVYGFGTFYIKQVNFYMFEYIQMIPFFSLMLIFTIICRIGFGSAIPIQPTWTYKMNLDITSKYYGLFGFFPEVLYLCVLMGNLFIDFVFWVFLKIGLEPVQQQDIKRVPIIKAKFQKLETKDNLMQKSNIYMIENAYDFQRFD